MSQVETIRIEIEQKKEMIAIGEAIGRIVRTRDWKKVIESEYLEKEPQRLVSLLAHPGMQDEASQKEIHNQMVMLHLRLLTFVQNLQRVDPFTVSPALPAPESFTPSADLVTFLQTSYRKSLSKYYIT